MDFEYVRDNIRIAAKRAGGQVPLAEAAEMKQSQISDYLTGKTKIENMTLGTFAKIFPLAIINFFGESESAEIETESSVMEERLLTFFRRLSPADQADCLILFGSKYGESIK